MAFNRDALQQIANITDGKSGECTSSEIRELNKLGYAEWVAHYGPRITAKGCAALECTCGDSMVEDQRTFTGAHHRMDCPSYRTLDQ